MTGRQTASSEPWSSRNFSLGALIPNFTSQLRWINRYWELPRALYAGRSSQRAQGLGVDGARWSVPSVIHISTPLHRILPSKYRDLRMERCTLGQTVRREY